MGSTISRTYIIDTITSLGVHPVSIAMLGLDGAGKTTALYRLKFDQYINTVPTIGFNCERIKGSSGKSKGVTFLVWDVGGQDKLRPLWKSYTRGTDGIIFVLDASDTDRLEEARIELIRMLRSPSYSSIPVLILANKQDLPKAKDGPTVESLIGTNEFGPNQLYHVQPACAITGEGLQEGLEKLYELVCKKKKLAKNNTNKGFVRKR